MNLPLRTASIVLRKLRFIVYPFSFSKISTYLFIAVAAVFRDRISQGSLGYLLIFKPTMVEPWNDFWWQPTALQPSSPNPHNSKILLSVPYLSSKFLTCTWPTLKISYWLSSVAMENLVFSASLLSNTPNQIKYHILPGHRHHFLVQFFYYNDHINNCSSVYIPVFGPILLSLELRFSTYSTLRLSHLSFSIGSRSLGNVLTF